jgi:hypothetical protein
MDHFIEVEIALAQALYINDFVMLYWTNKIVENIDFY